MWLASGSGKQHPQTFACLCTRNATENSWDGRGSMEAQWSKGLRLGRIAVLHMSAVHQYTDVHTGEIFC